MPAAPDTALLLVNLGTPDAPTPGAVRRYLAEFLSDPRVVQLPHWLWKPLLHGVILPLRGARVARKYTAIWTDAGSPLAMHTRALTAAVQQRLPQFRVVQAMRYGQPALAPTLHALRSEGIRRVLVLPLYPQYSTTTTASVADVLAGVEGIETRLVHDYHVDAGWVAAVADAIRAHWQAHGRGEKLLFSFHGIPQRLVDAGDPYAAQCAAGVAAIARTLGLGSDAYVLTYQSRFGREAWLQPATQAALQAMAATGVRRVDVVCPGFAVDCLETLEEIAMVNAQAFRDAGGEALHYVPCLNASSAHANTLAVLAQRELAAW